MVSVASKRERLLPSLATLKGKTVKTTSETMNYPAILWDSPEAKALRMEIDIDDVMTLKEAMGGKGKCPFLLRRL